MKVYLYPADQWGCGSYRIMWPAQAVAEAQPDWQVTVVIPGERSVPMEFDPRTGKVVKEGFPQDADVVVLQRPANFFQPQLVDLLRARGVAVVVDMDDDLAHIDGSNPAFRSLAARVPHPQFEQLSPVDKARLSEQRMVPNMNSFHHATEACRRATLVTVTTPQLAKVYGGHGRVRVIPNQVPASYLGIPHEDSDLIGWGGTAHTHPYDLQQVGASVAKLVRGGHRFETVGDPDGVAKALGLNADPGGPGVVGILDWPGAIGRFGIGLAPLADTRFNRGKSWLKPLEYAAVGVPAVVSPLDDYQRWAERCGGCLLAAKPKQWEGIVRALARDPGRRQEMSEAGRAAAASNTIEGNAWWWAEAWADAVELQHTKVTAGAG